MKNAYRWYTTLLLVTAAVGLYSVDWAPFFDLRRVDLIGLGVLVALAVLSEYLAVSVVVGKSKANSSVTPILFYASIILFGPAPTVVFAATTGVIWYFILQRKAFWGGTFNCVQYILATMIGGAVFLALGGQSSVDSLQLSSLPQFLVFGLIVNLFNAIAVTVWYSLKKQLKPVRVFQSFAGPWGTNLVLDLFVSPIALVVALFYTEFSVGGLALAVFPLLYVRLSYLSRQRLQEANRSLVKALIKAIETRDPYTSGHSLRVSSLARRIAEALGLPEHKVENIETAALLHDIGKVEAAYSQILTKPEGLSLEERQMIESHPTRGAELLQSLSSFPKEVIEGVRYHHERVDGKGYPAGLVKDQIPLAAKIIMVCDAVDAMLSDRPYRRALSREEVRRQLEIFRDVQFDGEIVDTILEHSVIDKYVDEYEASADGSTEDDTFSTIKADIESILEMNPRVVRK